MYNKMTNIPHSAMKTWIEAMRLRTLPVSLSGVIAGTACSIMCESFKFVPTLLCLMFATLAQVASNFANEYFDYKNGLDKKGRVGFRRGVTEGDISSQAMKWATYATLAIAAIIGLMMLFYGEWWMVIVGAFIGVFALAYSAGPYPLSHHGLGDVAVVIFFGIVPVTLTCYLQTGSWDSLTLSLPTSLSVGLLAANVLVVNNYRDMDDDKAVGKHTTVVLFGRKAMSRWYMAAGVMGVCVMWNVWTKLSIYSWIIPLVYLYLHISTWKRLTRSEGAALNPILGETAKNLLLYSVGLLLCSLIIPFCG